MAQALSDQVSCSRSLAALCCLHGSIMAGGLILQSLRRRVAMASAAPLLAPWLAMRLSLSSGISSCGWGQNKFFLVVVALVVQFVLGAVPFWAVENYGVLYFLVVVALVVQFFELGAVPFWAVKVRNED